MKEQTPTPLRPEQAADVIRYFDAAENDGYRQKGWRAKVSLGRVAYHTTKGEHSILPGGAPMLTLGEAQEGFKHITAEALSPWPVEPSDDQWEEIYQYADKKPCPVDEAYFEIMGIKPSYWN